MSFEEPWKGDIEAAVRLIDTITFQIEDLEQELISDGADHRYVPLLCTVPGIGHVLGYTIAAEIGDITRFATPTKLVGYSGLCPRVYQSGESDHRGSLTKTAPSICVGRSSRQPPTLLAIAPTQSATSAPVPASDATGKEIARVDIARRLAEAIWHMLQKNEPFAPAGAA